MVDESAVARLGKVLLEKGDAALAHTGTHLVAKGGTGGAAGLGQILREQLTDQEAAQLAMIATANRAGATFEMQQAMDPTMLQAAQHDLGVRPELTGVIEQPDGVQIFTRKGHTLKPHALGLATSTEIATVKPGALSRRETIDVDATKHRHGQNTGRSLG